MSRRIYFSWADFDASINALCDSLATFEFVGVYGVPRGGVILAVIISHRLSIPYITNLDVGRGGDGLLIVDDIADTGHTIKRLKSVYDTATYATLDYNPSSVVEPDFWINTKQDSDWIVYPWEETDSEEIQDWKINPKTITGNQLPMTSDQERRQVQLRKGNKD
jgi:xanthine phosphoribosyltransferase